MIGPAAGSAPSITGNGTHEPGRERFRRVVRPPPGDLPTLPRRPRSPRRGRLASIQWRMDVL